MFNSKIKVISEDLELSKTLSSLDFTLVLQAVKVIVNNSINSNFFIIKLVYNSNIRNVNLTYLRGLEVEELTKTQKITFLKSSLAYLLPKEYINDVSVNEDVPLFIGDDKPVVIAFKNSEERAEYNEADEIRKAEMEKELRVDVWS